MHPADKLGRTNRIIRGGYTRRGVNCGVVRQSNCTQQIRPAIMLIAHQFGYHIVHAKVHSFTLRICLRSVSGSFEMGHTQSLVEQLHNFP